jgi:hypothetical protein
MANSAWLVLAAITFNLTAFNLTQAAARLASHNPRPCPHQHRARAPSSP